MLPPHKHYWLACVMVAVLLERPHGSYPATTQRTTTMDGHALQPVGIPKCKTSSPAAYDSRPHIGL